MLSSTFSLLFSHLVSLFLSPGSPFPWLLKTRGLWDLGGGQALCCTGPVLAELLVALGFRLFG